jgi:hypothetical protein
MSLTSNSLESYMMEFDREFPPQKRMKMLQEEKDANSISLSGFSQDYISFELQMLADEQLQDDDASNKIVATQIAEARKITVLSEIIIPPPKHYNGLFHIVNYGASSSSKRTADAGVQTDSTISANVETQTAYESQNVSIFIFSKN